MIFETFVKDVNEITDILNELEDDYKGFELLTILSISSGYIIYYKLGEKK